METEIKQALAKKKRAFLLKLEVEVFNEVLKSADGRPVTLWIKRAIQEYLNKQNDTTRISNN